MKKIILIVIMSIEAIFNVFAQDYRTKIFNDDIKTLQIYPQEDVVGMPVLDLYSDDKLIVSFDEMVFSAKNYYYKIIHCNKNWEKSSLSEMEYLDGYQNNRIEEINLSQNTVTNYTNYRFSVPSNNYSFKVSGNYAVIISQNGDFTNPDAIVNFYVVDMKVVVEADITSHTDIAYNGYYQQLEMDVLHNGYTIYNPFDELSVNVMQNRRTDNMAIDVKPSFTAVGKQTYNHKKELIFEGGNEYRFIDFASEYTYSGEIDEIAIEPSKYTVFTIPATPRKGSYLPSNYGNAYGRYIINRENYDNDYNNSDYMFVNFIIPNNLEYYAYDIYILSDIFNNQFNELSKMKLDSELNILYNQAFLKQGGYSYLYAFVPKNSRGNIVPLPLLQEFEGSFWQTSNEYTIFVYHHDFLSKYDKLIGFSTIKSN